MAESQMPYLGLGGLSMWLVRRHFLFLLARQITLS